MDAKDIKSQPFQAEVARLLQLMIHSVYAEKDVFLRELLSNASDACDKFRTQSQADSKLHALSGNKPRIVITCAADKGHITITDNGIGMARKELEANLGTIARSGTRAFIAQMEKSKDAELKGNPNGHGSLIGQFGVGFYSVFMVAAKVTVTSCFAGLKKPWVWESEGGDSFSVRPHEKDDPPLFDIHGTAVRLVLKDKEKSYANKETVERIVHRYSDHIAVPIYLKNDGAEEKEQLINAQAALWSKPKSAVKPEQYDTLYQSLSHTSEQPLLKVHYHAEGRHDYHVLLFVPSTPPFDLYEPSRQGHVRLYVRRVFITEDSDILPRYLRFLYGVIDSADMPLTLSREMLQNNATIARMRTAVTKRVRSALLACSEKDAKTYEKIWENFGGVLKEGLYEDVQAQESWLPLARFRSTTHSKETRSLAAYVESMPKEQDAIYYLTGDDKDVLASSPQLEGFARHGLEVLLLSDPVDEFWLSTGVSYNTKPFKSVNAGGIDFSAFSQDKKSELEKSAQQTAAGMATLIAAMKQTLHDKVVDVHTSQRLTDSPACLVDGEDGMTARLHKILAERQKLDSAPKRILEINPSHPLILGLAAALEKDGLKQDVEDAMRLLLDETYILEGDLPQEPAASAKRIIGLLEKQFNPKG